MAYQDGEVLGTEDFFELGDQMCIEYLAQSDPDRWIDEAIAFVRADDEQFVYEGGEDGFTNPDAIDQILDTFKNGYIGALASQIEGC